MGSCWVNVPLLNYGSFSITFGASGKKALKIILLCIKDNVTGGR